MKGSAMDLYCDDARAYFSDAKYQKVEGGPPQCFGCKYERGFMACKKKRIRKHGLVPSAVYFGETQCPFKKLKAEPPRLKIRCRVRGSPEQPLPPVDSGSCPCPEE